LKKSDRSICGVWCLYPCISNELTDVFVRIASSHQGRQHAAIAYSKRIVVGFASETKFAQPVLVDPRRASLGSDVLGLSAECGFGMGAREEGHREAQSNVCDAGHGSVRAGLLLLWVMMMTMMMMMCVEREVCVSVCVCVCVCVCVKGRLDIHTGL
jgi:hypothetical protein